MKNKIELYAEDLHFLGETDEEKRYDLCLHGKATLRVNGHTFADGIECCISASALRFLRSLSSDHKTGEEEFLFPCCANMMIPSDDGKTVTVIGCPNGIDFSVLHNENFIILVLPGVEQVPIGLSEYKTAVLCYAKTIIDFMQNSPERIFKDDFEKAGYEAFLTEFNDLMAKYTL